CNEALGGVGWGGVGGRRSKRLRGPRGWRRHVGPKMTTEGGMCFVNGFAGRRYDACPRVSDGLSCLGRRREVVHSSVIPTSGVLPPFAACCHRLAIGLMTEAIC
ncbi:hypothetical protein GW17_00054741, partial [Ensete ventricosum]